MQKRKTDKIANMAAISIQNMIRRGELIPGQCLPSQRDLALALGVSRTSLREAISTLETLGWIKTAPRRKAIILNAAADTKATDITAWRSESSPGEIYQFRIMLECHATAQVATDATKAQLDKLWANLTDFRRLLQEEDLVSAVQCDAEFHGMIVEFSQNRLLANCYAQHAHLFRETQSRPLMQRNRLLETVWEHENILTAIVAHDPDRAAYFMKIHIMRSADRSNVQLDPMTSRY